MEIIKNVAIGTLFVVLLVILGTGMAIGMWAAIHWHLPASGSGGLAVIGGFAAQVVAGVGLFAIGEIGGTSTTIV